MTAPPELRIVPADGDARLEDWRYVHNAIVPPAAMGLDDVRERARRNRLAVAYLGDVLVGCSTVRPPTGEERKSTVIARVLPGYRGRGIGVALYARGLAHARELGAAAIETVVLASNVEGLRFATKQGFTETERYVLPGESAEWVDLRLGK